MRDQLLSGYDPERELIRRLVEALEKCQDAMRLLAPAVFMVTVRDHVVIAEAKALADIVLADARADTRED